MNVDHEVPTASTVPIDTDYSDLVDSIDESLTALFRRDDLPDDEHPLRMYGLLRTLLAPLGQYAFGATSPKHFAPCPEFTSALDETSTLLHRQFVRILRPAYVAANYWSPMDGERHTLHFRAEPPPIDKEKEALSAALLFFAISLNGPKHSDNARKLYSATQFTAAAAQRKRGVRVCYWNRTEYDDLATLWHIPETHFKGLLQDTGVEEVRLRIQRRYTIDELKQLLNAYLVNCVDGVADIAAIRGQLEADAEQCLEEFRRLQLAALPSSIQEAAKAATRYAAWHFGAELNDLQGLFMATSNVLYNKDACPCQYYYGFPVRIGDTCCVMTLGTREHLDTRRHLTVARLVTSLFSRALLADHKTIATASNQRVALFAMQSTTDLCMNSMFSHDARNKVHALRNDLDALDELLSERKLPSERAALVSECVNGLRKATDSLDTLMAASLKALRQAQGEVFEDVEPKEAMEEAVRTAWEGALTKLKTHPLPVGPPVEWLGTNIEGVRVRLLKGMFVLGMAQVLRGFFEQVLSCKANVVRISASVLAGGQASGIEITISDDGPGFPDEVLAAISGGKPVASKTGEGLGYILAKACIGGKNRGRLRAENLDGNGQVHGARVIVTLSQ